MDLSSRSGSRGCGSGVPEPDPSLSRASVALPERLSILESTRVKAPIPPSSYTRLHLQFGWWSLLVFAGARARARDIAGVQGTSIRGCLERHAPAHVDAGACPRGGPRADSRPVCPQPAGPAGPAPGRDRLVSRCLIAASVLLPGGFFAGGVDLLCRRPRPGHPARPGRCLSSAYGRVPGRPRHQTNGSAARIRRSPPEKLTGILDPRMDPVLA